MCNERFAAVAGPSEEEKRQAERRKAVEQKWNSFLLRGSCPKPSKVLHVFLPGLYRCNVTLHGFGEGDFTSLLSFSGPAGPVTVKSLFSATLFLAPSLQVS